MTYLTFLLLFLAPPLLVLYRPGGRWRRIPRARLAVAALPAIALAYTTPWDNWLVASGVWTYGRDRVLGTIGWVPVEEYAFFVLQPLLVVGWLLWRGLPDSDASDASRRTGSRSSDAAAGPGRRQAESGATPVLVASPPRVGGHAAGRTMRLAGAAFWLVVAAAGAVMLASEGTRYMGLILAWAAPVVACQWWLTGDVVRRAVWYLSVVAPPTLYLWFADAVAIGAGIWRITERYTIGVAPFGLPVEEMTFFLTTTLLSVHGALLFLEPSRLRWTSTSS